jgi:hypothetical protein
MPSKTNGDSDFGLLYAVDDELALYGWLTNTGIKIVVAIETPVGGEVEGGMALVREGDVKGVSTIPRGRGALLRAGGDHWLRKWVTVWRIWLMVFRFSKPFKLPTYPSSAIPSTKTTRHDLLNHGGS